MTEIKKSSINPLAVVLGISAILFGFFMIFSFVYFFTQGKDKDHEKAGLFSDHGNYIGVIELKGVIMDSKKILKNLSDAADDKDIKGVIFRMNSPGGSVAPSQEIYEAVKVFPKPLIVSMGSIAASGAYYIAAGAKTVYANSGTLTGSIGVIMEFANLKKLYEWAKVERYTIKTGRFKDSGAEYREMQPDEKEYFQNLVLDTLGQFKEAVAKGRNMTPEEVTAIADGRVFTGNQALKLKMIDKIGTFDDVVKELATELKIKGKPKLAYPAKKSMGLQELILGGGKEDEDGFEEGHSFIDGIASKIADRILGVQTEGALSRPAGLYSIWNGSR